MERGVSRYVMHGSMILVSLLQIWDSGLRQSTVLIELTMMARTLLRIVDGLLIVNKPVTRETKPIMVAIGCTRKGVDAGVVVVLCTIIALPVNRPKKLRLPRLGEGCLAGCRKADREQEFRLSH